MAAIIRLNNRALLQGLVLQNFRNGRLISTSEKNRETATVSQTKSTETTAKKPWVSYGFDFHNEAGDRNSMKSTFFFSVTLCLVWGTFFWAYLPDIQNRDWAQREGYLELRRREQKGMDLVSPNYVDPKTVKLPPEESLGKTEIII